MNGNGGPDQRFQVMMVVWGALLGGMLLFAAALWLLASGVLTGRPWPAALDPGVGFAFLGVAMVLLAGSIVFRPSRSSGTDSADPLQAYWTRVVVVAAVQEGAGLMGCVFALLAGLPTWIPVMAGLAGFAMVLTRPRRDVVDRIRRS